MYAIREFSFTVDFSTVFSQLKINHTLTVCIWYSSVKRLGQLAQGKRQRRFRVAIRQLNLFRPQFDDLITDVWPNIDNCVGATSRINIEAGRNAELDGKWGQSLGLRDDLAVKGARILKMIPRKMAAA